MKEHVAFESPNHYTLMEREDAQTSRAMQLRVNHRRNEPGRRKRDFLMNHLRLDECM